MLPLGSADDQSQHSHHLDADAAQERDDEHVSEADEEDCRAHDNHYVRLQRAVELAAIPTAADALLDDDDRE